MSSSNSASSIFVVVGAGQAGFWASKTLRGQGFVGRIVLIGEESHLPYERPPLSKAVLLGEQPPEAAHLCKLHDLEANQIECLHDTRVESINRESRRLTLSNGSELSYDRLLIATGGRCRALSTPGAHLNGIHYLRTIDDSVALQQSLQADNALLVVGGGWIGLEVAASAAKRGVRVTVIEAAAQLCGRVLPADAAEYLRKIHTAHSVDIRLKTSVERFLGNGNAVVAGIGMIPNSELAAASGLAVRDGILVDQFGQTSDEAIYAAGDVARYQSARAGKSVRMESWSNAQNQAIAAAKTMAGAPTVYDPIPWFWSDQYDINLQVLGTPLNEHMIVTRGRIEDGSLSLFYLDAEDRIQAVISVNSARDNRITKRLMEKNHPVIAEKLSDTSADLQALLR
jgi:3-phenylpropionate/trans-cinnamate dioxygenase ferredoxin reductase component